MGRLFGTNGVRGLVNDEMDARLALDLGRALGTHLSAGSTVLVGRDTRTSGAMLAHALTAGLTSTGVHVHDGGITPTPALQFAIKTTKAYAAGVVITASHNPPEHNGIKFIDPDGTEMDAQTEEAIEAVYFDRTWRAASWDQIGRERHAPGVNDRYLDAILNVVDVDAIRSAALKVVLDTSNGAGSLTAPYLLQRLGVHVVTLNAQPDGTFPGHASEPTPENVKDLVAAVPALGAHLGVVQDGDADRCVFVDEYGGYVMGDRTLALMAGHAVARAGGGLVVTPVSSSSIVEKHVVAKGGQVRYTRVGSPIVARAMIGSNALLGGEENGGLIFPELQHCRDGSMTLAKVLELLATTGRPFSELLGEVPVAHSVKLKAPCPNDKKDAALDAFANAQTDGRVDRTDGVKVFVDDGWVLVRPSGTEPIVRVFAEGTTPEAAEALAKRALEQVASVIAGL